MKKTTTDRSLKEELIRLAYEQPELRRDILPLVREEVTSDTQKKTSALPKSFKEYTEKWFEDLGKLVVKYCSKKVNYKNVHSEGVFFRIQGQKEMAWIKYANRQFEFSMSDQRYRVFRNTDSLEKIASTIAKSIDNV